MISPSTIHANKLTDFDISADGVVSTEFVQKGIATFATAAAYVKNLPYARNQNKNNILCPLTDGCGTCSTKHALLRQLAVEHNVDNIRLTVGIFKMNAANTPEVADTLAKHNLEYIPEAHRYLTINGQITDYTKKEWTTTAFVKHLLQETDITPQQSTDHKIAMHKAFLTNWLQHNPHIPYNLEELFAIREECILDLFTKNSSI